MTAIKSASICIIVSLLFFFFPNNSYPVDCVNSRFLVDISTTADQPSDISVGPNGDVYLVDGVNNRIIVLDGKGKNEIFFRQGRNGPRGIHTPAGD